MRLLVRLAAHLWPLPYTLAGIAIGLLLAGRFRRNEGVVEIHGPGIAAALRQIPIEPMAITFGHVVLGQTSAALEVTRDHERIHVRQYERWGVLFVPAYLAASMVLLVRGHDAYRDNPFEVEAYGSSRHQPD